MRAMAEEPSFVSAVLSEDRDAADELVLFEMWSGLFSSHRSRIKPSTTVRLGPQCREGGTVF
ncbi:hypothetical protein [Burkholderia pyrrocinia]|uniref:hypothetical protein n=1 Tax=Burkholderia pyrrocinia TaxID=60550 RepID=UPI0039F17AB4